MIASILQWWLLSSLIAYSAVPLGWRLFSRLPDRGFGFSRALGLMIASYLLWLGASLRWIPNSLGGAAFSWIVLLLVSAYLTRKHLAELKTWIVEKWRLLVTMEVLFFLAFTLWSFVRANNPEIIGTEKPMELAFLNSILRSEQFPPLDPWLSNHAISYYYSGFVQLAYLTRLSGVGAGVAFNLGNALWFAMSIVSVYALLYNLLALARGTTGILAPLLAPLFTLISGNLEGFLEVLHARHIFWRMDSAGGLTSSFWGWLNIKDLSAAPAPDPAWISSRHWWWWRASRVVNDVNLQGAPVEVIDEFPFFSFLLADNHPHLLAIPFVIMAVAFSLQVFSRDGQGPFKFTRMSNQNVFNRTSGFVLILLALGWGVRGAALAAGVETSFAGTVLAFLVDTVKAGVVLGTFALLAGLLLGVLPSALTSGEFLFGAWLFGGLLFMNLTDFPIYFSLFVLVIIWKQRGGSFRALTARVGPTILGLTGAAILYYLPWYPSYNTQASGILPNLVFPTRWAHFVVMFGTLLFPIAAWLIWSNRSWLRREWTRLLGLGIGLSYGLLLASWILGGMIGLSLQVRQPLALEAALGGMGAATTDEVVRATVQRLVVPWTSLTVAFLIALGVLSIWRAARRSTRARDGPDHVRVFVIFMLIIGGLLVLGPEHLYIRDLFGTRMNTVFKFYFGAWLLWGVAAAFAVHDLWHQRGTGLTVLKVATVVPLLLGLIYPSMATWTKTNGFRPDAGRTLDGSEYMASHYPGDYAAIEWIRENLPLGVVAEAVGGSYQHPFARVSTYTGFPAVLGWDFHEVQWRGSAQAQGSRRADIERLYLTRQWEEAASILDMYAVDYVYIGQLERMAYEPLQEEKFSLYMQLVYENQDVRIYRPRGDS